MAVITLGSNKEEIKGNENVKTYLKKQGFLFENWNIGKLPTNLEHKFTLTDEEKEEILDTFNDEIKSLAEKKGYKNWDVVVLSEEMPNLEEILVEFGQVHMYSEEEVRAITAGRVKYMVEGVDGYFEIELEPGDVISISENTSHSFTLMGDREVVAIRLFHSSKDRVFY